MHYLNIFRRIVFLSALWACPLALADDYIVEMIFFAHEGNNWEPSVHAQKQSPHQPDIQSAIPLNDSAVFYDFLPLSENEFRLHDLANLLTTSGKYRVMQHVAWLQPGLAKEAAIPVRIQAGKDFNDTFKELKPIQVDSSNAAELGKISVRELDGTVKVFLARYLHIFTDLIYRRPSGSEALPSTEFDSSGRDLHLTEHALKAHRKMRSEELHYIDHPLFGILVEIRSAENED